MKRVILICLILYLIAFGWLTYNVMISGIHTDRVDEYEEYSQILERGGTWQYIPDRLVNASIFSTLIPARIQLLTHIDEVVVFKIFPCFFYALVPPFIFLIARRYMKDGLAITASLFMMSQYYFFHFINPGRSEIAFGCLAIFAWALISKRYLILLISGIIIVFAHYGTAAITIFIGGVTLIGLIIQYRTKIREYYKLVIAGLIIIAFAGVWYFIFVGDVGKYITHFVVSSTDAFDTQPSFISEPIIPESSESIVPIAYDEPQFEITLQYAFAQKWGEMNYWQKMEWFTCWAIILSLIGGIIWAIKTGMLRGLHLYMTIATLIICAVPVFSPWASLKYGVLRAFTTGLIIIAPFFVYGLATLARKIHFNEYILPGTLIAANCVIVSGAEPPYLWGIIQ